MDTIIIAIDVLRWLIAIPLLFISAFFIFTNLGFLFDNIRLGLDAGPAPVTIMGGLSGCLGMLVLPVMGFGDRLALIWIPLFLDLGSAPFYLGMLGLAILQHFNSKIWRSQPDYTEGGKN